MKDNSMKYRFLLAIVLLACTSCTGWLEKMAAGDCKRAGISVSSPGYGSCVQDRLVAMKAEQQAEGQATRDLFGAAAGVAAGAYVYSKTAPHSHASGSRSSAPLVGQRFENFQRICTYAIPTGNVTVTTVGGQMCPDTYAY